MTKRNLSSQYSPAEVEERWYQIWEKNGWFKAQPQSGKPPFSIVIPPPNVTGSLHIGHALNNSLQDLLIRYKRMNGFDALWIPGCDHAGIATQNVVERHLDAQKSSREALGREKFLEKVWEWKQQYGSTIMRQLRRLGASCDWDHERFTMDEGLSAAVREVFVQFYEKKLIYQGDYIINWCPRCETALSDIEVEHQDENGKLYLIRYPVSGRDGEYVVVATTRPETLMGDTAVCVNPKDNRFTDFHGSMLELPVMKRKIPLILDDYVEMDFGTGALKITPAHDANDFEIGSRFNLERIKVMDERGVMNENAGPYQGMDRFACRKQIVKDLEQAGLLEKIEDYNHAVGHCYRCDTVVESYLSKQWFVSMKPLAKKALEALGNGETRFLPSNWKKVYSDWLENIRDWCISRQIWWGHRIPVFYSNDGRKTAAHTLEEAAGKLKVPVQELRQDDDVLDTWFSSGLWPFSTLGWPQQTEDLKRYYPTSTLVTSWDILFFWVARMSMFGLEAIGEVPFKEVFINSLVADEHGQKMSKSKGNVIDPLTKIDTIGADALRFALMSIESQSRYISLSEEKMQAGRNFMNKIWNAARFMIMNLEEMDLNRKPVRPEVTDLADRWILWRLDICTRQVNHYLENGYQVNQMASTLHDFFWHDFCDWYIETVKNRLSQKDESGDMARCTLAFTLEQTLRLLHPMCPFITEEIWQLIPHSGDTIMLQQWPQAVEESKLDHEEAGRQFGILIEAVRAVRNIRAEMKVDAARVVDAVIRVADENEKQLVVAQKGMLETMARIKLGAVEIDLAKPPSSAAAVAGSLQIFLPLAGMLDLDVERKRLEKEIMNFRKFAEGTRRKLENESFVSKAPVQVVESEKEKLRKYEDQIVRLQGNLSDLGS